MLQNLSHFEARQWREQESRGGFLHRSRFERAGGPNRSRLKRGEVPTGIDVAV